MDDLLVDAAATDGVLVVAHSPSRIWTTVDGNTWKAVPAEGLGTNAELEALVAWDQGVAAIGNDVGPRSWTGARTEHGFAVQSDDIDPFEAVAVAHGDGLVAVGADPKDISSAVAWSSTDGLSWSAPNRVGSGHVSGVDALGEGLIAVGFADSGVPMTGVSPGLVEELGRVQPASRRHLGILRWSVLEADSHRA